MDDAAAAPVDAVFRRHYGRLVASLTRVFGPARLDLVEDVVQDAMLRAVRTWPYHGVPADPAAWLSRVAQRLALDVLRRRASFAAKSEDVARLAAERASDLASRAADPDGIADDALRMMFTCCHPALPVDTRVSLTLKTLCGFGTSEIARALLCKEATIAQRLTRAKAKLQRDAIEFEVPGPDELPGRLGSVLDVLYLMFNEGYRAHCGAELTRPELVLEAVRLADLATGIRSSRAPEVWALLALMRFLGARLPARVAESGEILTLAEQDRSRWDRAWIGAGFAAFQRSIDGPALTPLHVEAAIASLHALAPDYDSTDWPLILQRYEQLLGFGDRPLVRLNRTVALAKVRGLAAARAELDALGDPPELQGYVLLPATRAHFAWHAGDHAAAIAHYDLALQLGCTLPERALLTRRREDCRIGRAAPRF